MTDGMKGFFDALEQRDHEPLVEKADGTIRFEVRDNGHVDRWLLTIDRGDLNVAHKGGPADCTVRADRSTLERIAGGEMNAFSALLRGVIDVEGDNELLLMFQRLLPDPPKGRASQGGGRVR
jgi:putative sterol carrier protein